MIYFLNMSSEVPPEQGPEKEEGEKIIAENVEKLSEPGSRLFFNGRGEAIIHAIVDHHTGRILRLEEGVGEMKMNETSIRLIYRLHRNPFREGAREEPFLASVSRLITSLDYEPDDPWSKKSYQIANIDKLVDEPLHRFKRAVEEVNRLAEQTH